MKLTVTIVAAVIGLISLIFGEGIYDRFRGPQVRVHRVAAEIPWPQTVRDIAEDIGSTSNMTQAMLSMVQESQQRSTLPEAPADARSLDDLASDLARLLPETTRDDAKTDLLTAILLRQYGLMRTAMVRTLEDKRLLFPSVLVTLTLSNDGRRVATNVDLVMEGDLEIVEQSIQGIPRPSGPRKEPIGLPGNEKTRFTYHVDRLPAGEDHTSVISLWVAIPDTADIRSWDWVAMRVMHDDGEGTGSIVDGPTLSLPRGALPVPRALSFLASVVFTALSLGYYFEARKRSRR